VKIVTTDTIGVEAIECGGPGRGGFELIITEDNKAEVEACPSLAYTQIKVESPITRLDLSNARVFLDQLWVTSTSLQELLVPYIPEAQEIIIDNLPPSASIVFSSLTVVRGSLNLNSVSFPSVSFPKLASASSITITSGTGDLDDTVFPVLTAINGIVIRNSAFLRIRGFNNHLRPYQTYYASPIQLSGLADSTIEGFNGGMAISSIALTNLQNVTISGFNGAITLSDDCQYYCYYDPIETYFRMRDWTDVPRRIQWCLIEC